MQLPSWLAKATGATAFANNPANGFQPTIGDALQGIGHSMMENYRRRQMPHQAQPQVGSVPQPPSLPPIDPITRRGLQSPPPVDQPAWGGLPISTIASLFR